jgi:hypothetical protein
MIKKEPQFIVLSKRTIHHEGDQRSRDFPGHGYGTYSEEIDVVTELFDEEGLREYLLGEELSLYRVYKVTPVKVSKIVSIDINR